MLRKISDKCLLYWIVLGHTFLLIACIFNPAFLKFMVLPRIILSIFGCVYYNVFVLYKLHRGLACSVYIMDYSHILSNSIFLIFVDLILLGSFKQQLNLMLFFFAGVLKTVC